MQVLPATPLYQQIAGRIGSMIEAGTLRAGDRLPSVRQSSLQHDVSIPTILQAYALLENRGLIEARPKSGYYVRARLVKPLPVPRPVRRKPAVSSLAAFDPTLSMAQDVVDPTLAPLGGAIPSAELLPQAKLARLTASISRRHPAVAFNYDPVPGCLPLRQQLSRHSLDWGCPLDPDDFVVTTGASEAIHLALLAVTRPSDTVIVESPAYYGTLNLLAQLKLKALAIATSATDGIDIDAVEAALACHRVAAVIVIPNFTNPSGGFMPEANRRRLIELADRHGAIIIEDDIYGDLPHHGPRPHVLKSFDADNHVMLCGSYSKTLSPGLRVGYLAPGRHRRRVIELKNALTLGGPPLQPLTVAEFLRNGGYERHLRKLRHAYHTNVCRMRQAVAEAFPDGTCVSNPHGGFVLWLELPGKPDILEIYQTARSAGVNFAPGTLFSPNGRFRNCLRLSCGAPWGPVIERAVQTLGRIVRSSKVG